MKKLMTIVLLTGLLIGLSLMMTSCGGRGSGVYRYHHGNGPWWGNRVYYRDRIVVPDRDLDVEATPLPSGPEEMPDMGMPDMDFGDMGGDW